MKENKIRLILDLETQRVIYFTDDFEEELSLDESVVCYDYLDELPEKLKLTNCWNWKVENNKLVHTPKEEKNKPPRINIFQHNKNRSFLFPMVIPLNKLKKTTTF